MISLIILDCPQGGGGREVGPAGGGGKAGQDISPGEGEDPADCRAGELSVSQLSSDSK